jgi:hypothetical protein
MINANAFARAAVRVAKREKLGEKNKVSTDENLSKELDAAKQNAEFTKQEARAINKLSNDEIEVLKKLAQQKISSSKKNLRSRPLLSNEALSNSRDDLGTGVHI